MKHSFLLILISLSVLFTGCNTTSDSDGIDDAIGRTAPNFSYNTLDGQQITLSDFQRKVVYLFFYGAGCPHCRSNGPVTEFQINSVFESDSNFVAFGLDTWNNSVSQNNSFKNATSISYPLLLNARQSLIDYYGSASAYDRSVVIDTNGKIAYQGSGFVNTDVNKVVETVRAELENIKS